MTTRRVRRLKMLGVLFTFALLTGLVAGVLILAPPLTALFALVGFAGAVFLVAALTSAFRRPAMGRDRLLGV